MVASRSKDVVTDYGCSTSNDGVTDYGCSTSNETVTKSGGTSHCTEYGSLFLQRLQIGNQIFLLLRSQFGLEHHVEEFD
jgi:hypothetical protein